MIAIIPNYQKTKSELKLTMLLFNVTLKFLTQIKYYKYTDIFCCKNDSHIFPTKSNSAIIDNVVGIYLTR